MSDDWVEVRDEPRHRRRFEDEFVRVYDVLVPPGDTTLFHRHVEDTFYVAVNEATVHDTTYGESEGRTGTAPAGTVLCRPHRTRPLTHQVHNVGQGDMRLIGAEIKAAAPGRAGATTAPAALDAAGHQLVLERERLRVYQLDLEPGATTGAIQYPFASLTVFLTIATLETRTADGGRSVAVHAPADVIWRPAALAATITNVGEEPLRAVVGEWR